MSQNNLKHITALWSDHSLEMGQNLSYSKNDGNTHWARYMNQHVNPNTMNSPLSVKNVGHADGRKMKSAYFGSEKQQWVSSGYRDITVRYPVQEPVQIAVKTAVTNRVAVRVPVQVQVQVPVKTAVTNRVAVKVPIRVPVEGKTYVKTSISDPGDGLIYYNGFNSEKSKLKVLLVRGRC